MPKVIYSCPAPFNTFGNSIPLTHIKNALEKKYASDLTIISGQDFPYEAARTLAAGSLFDELSSFECNLECDLFLGVGYDSLLQIREVRKNGGKCITTHFSSHYRHAYDLLTEEYRKQNIKQEVIPPLLGWRGKNEHKMVDTIIVPSEMCASTYEKDPLCKGKVRVANFGVDNKKFHPPKEPVEDFEAMFVGGNWVRKGLPYLIQAWETFSINVLRRQGLVRRLTIIGPNVNFAGRSGAYRALGWVPDDSLPDMYRRSSVFVLPTLEEGQAMATLEAMASGLACIVSYESGAPIEDGKDGLIVPPRDPKKLQDALQYFYDNPDEIKRMGRNARAKAETLTWERFQDRIVEIVEELV